MSLIEENLYLGSFKEASSLKWLHANGITHILNTGIELENCFPRNFVYKHIHAQDHEEYNLYIHFDEIADFIDEGAQSGKVFVHCYRGVSRSSAAIIAYLMKIRFMNFKTAKDFCKMKRIIACPNTGFMKQLLKYEHELFTRCMDSARIEKLQKRHCFSNVNAKFRNIKQKSINDKKLYPYFDEYFGDEAKNHKKTTIDTEDFKESQIDSSLGEDLFGEIHQNYINGCQKSIKAEVNLKNKISSVLPIPYLENERVKSASTGRTYNFEHIMTECNNNLNLDSKPYNALAPISSRYFDYLKPTLGENQSLKVKNHLMFQKLSLSSLTKHREKMNANENSNLGSKSSTKFCVKQFKINQDSKFDNNLFITNCLPPQEFRSSKKNEHTKNSKLMKKLSPEKKELFRSMTDRYFVPGNKLNVIGETQQTNGFVRNRPVSAYRATFNNKCNFFLLKI